MTSHLLDIVEGLEVEAGVGEQGAPGVVHEG